ncbi:MAG: isochorismatase family protein [Candidatus Heimdallarchaeaceae archaeon]
MTFFNLEEVKPSNTIFIIIDPQPTIVSVTESPHKLMDNIILLLHCAKELTIPIILTEQYPKGLGNIDPCLAPLLPEDVKPISKMEFNCFDNAEFISKVNSFSSSHTFVAIVGVEAHICILQTVLGALKHKFKPIVVSDAISSRHRTDYETALNFYNNLKVPVLSTETLVYLLLKKAGTPEFKALLPFLK